MSKLKDWPNIDEVGTRFPPSRYMCPECNKPALQDTWPPDYGGGHGFMSLGGGPSGYDTNSSIKHVCVNCKIAFRVFEKESYRDGVRVNREVTYSENVPLIERDGYLLTSHDVWREDYYKEHGEYPIEAYG